jgi:hypothetical protein
MGGQVVKSCSSMVTEMGEKIGMDQARGLVPFRLVVHPFQPRVMVSYLVRSMWFPNHSPLEEIGSYPDFLGHNQQPAVPGV